MAQAPKVVRLPRLPVGWQDQPLLLEKYWDEAMNAIEKALNDLLAIPLIQEALATVDKKVEEAKKAASDAQNAANGAGSDSASAQQKADAEEKENSLVNSYVSSPTATPTADSTGVVTVNNHSRIYGNTTLNPTVAVTGGVISTGAPAGSVIRVYYVDVARAGGNVTYSFSVDPNPITPQGKDVHSVGAVVIPGTGTAPGKFLRPPGYVEP